MRIREKANALHVKLEEKKNPTKTQKILSFLKTIFHRINTNCIQEQKHWKKESQHIHPWNCDFLILDPLSEQVTDVALRL